MNLLRLPKPLPVGKEFSNTFIQEKSIKSGTYYTVKNMDKFKDMIKGYISYYMGAPAYTFPEIDY